jgi:hypothetical protein
LLGPGTIFLSLKKLLLFVNKSIEKSKALKWKIVLDFDNLDASYVTIHITSVDLDFIIHKMEIFNYIIFKYYSVGHEKQYSIIQ